MQNNKTRYIRMVDLVAGINSVYQIRLEAIKKTNPGRNFCTIRDEFETGSWL
jgi:hypothetical protein